MQTRLLLTSVLALVGALPSLARIIAVEPKEVADKINQRCSLTEAILVVNHTANNGDCKTIEDGSTQWTVKLPGGNYQIKEALPVITPDHPLAVKGGGAVIQWAGASGKLFSVLTIKTTADKPVALSDLLLTNGVAENGGGLFVEAGQVSFAGAIANNSVSKNGGGIFVAEGARLTVTKSRIEKNTAKGHGGGLAVAGMVTLAATAIDNNHADSDGGGLYCSGLLCTVQYSSILSNGATNGGGIMLVGAGELKSLNSTIGANQAADNGGGLYVASTLNNPAKLVNLTVTRNIAANRGGAFYAQSPLTVGFSNSLLAYNTATSNKNNECYGLLPAALNVVTEHAGENTCANSGAGLLPYPAADLPMQATPQSTGGYTKGYFLLAGSKAIDAGKNFTDLDGKPLTRDQRNVALFSRPYGAGYDVGALEYVSCPTCNGEKGQDDDGDGASEAQGDPNDSDKTITVSDKDGDGFIAPQDCNNTNAAIHPGAAEVCTNGAGDGIDNDCDGTIDNHAWYPDVDSDGFGSATLTFTGTCTGPSDADKATAANNGITHFADVPGDCDDSNVYTHPGQTEACNGKDDDCNGLIDDNIPADFCTDVNSCTKDICSHGQCLHPGVSCDDHNACTADSCDAAIGCAHDAIAGCNADADLDQDGVTVGNGDCDDGNATVAPNATEVCNFIDDDCDGKSDEGFPVTAFFYDRDGDAFGEAGSSKVRLCAAPTAAQLAELWAKSTVENNVIITTVTGDCNDLDSAIHPAVTVPSPDGHGAGVTPLDVCDGVDNDCDGTIDENPSLLFCIDNDSDGYTDHACLPACSADAVSHNKYINSTAALGEESAACDTNAAVHPGQTDIACDGIDNDCNGKIDDGIYPKQAWYIDADGDGHGSLQNGHLTSAACPITGRVLSNDDCDDAQKTTYPGAPESCNTTDSNCDGKTNQPLAFFKDGDGDGFGDPAQTLSQCDTPAGYVANGADCNDGNLAVHPGAAESCNTLDDDCNGQLDDGPIGTAWYQDADSDGFGGSVSTTACTQPTGYVATADDCDDAAAARHPGATEYCNATDDNCNGTADPDDQCVPIPGNGGGTCNGAAPGVWFLDADADDYGDPAHTITQCTQPAGHVAIGGDCADNNAAVHPTATESCNNIDDNCNGTIDTDAIGGTTWYRDFDGDGVGGPMTLAACTKPQGYSLDTGDCDESKKTSYPGAVELCNGVDDNCNGSIADEVNCDAGSTGGADGATGGGGSTGGTDSANPNDTGGSTPTGSPTGDSSAAGNDTPIVPDMGGSSAPLNDGTVGSTTAPIPSADNTPTTASEGGVLVEGSGGGCSLFHAE